MCNIANGLVNYYLLAYLLMPAIATITGKTPYKIVYSCKLHLLIDFVVWLVYMPAVEDYLSSLQKLWTKVHEWLTKKAEVNRQQANKV